MQNIMDCIHDVVIIKTGIVISDSELLDILQEGFPNDPNLRISDDGTDRTIRMRSEEFDFYCWHVRKQLGELEREQSQLNLFSSRLSPWLDKGHNPAFVHEQVVDIMTQNNDPDSQKPVSLAKVLLEVEKRKIRPRELVMDVIAAIIEDQKSSNVIFTAQAKFLESGIPLKDLFKKESVPTNDGSFFEQRFINFLEANPEKLEFMHWRNFERLTAEFFHRDGFTVSLGPGSKDEGVDVRVYNQEDDRQPYIIIQCKRHKTSRDVKIEVVKSIYTDVLFENATKGLIATTSRIAPGGKKVCSIRKYPLEFAENKEIRQWVNQMKKR